MLCPVLVLSLVHAGKLYIVGAAALSCIAFSHLLSK